MTDDWNCARDQEKGRFCREMAEIVQPADAKKGLLLSAKGEIIYLTGEKGSKPLAVLFCPWCGVEYEK